MNNPTPAITVRYGSIDSGYATRLATTPPEQDGPVWMVNLMSYRPLAEYADGRATTLTGRDADDEYAPLGPLAAVGAQVVLFADVEDQLLGDAPRWHRVGVVKYPTRRSFIEMQSLPEFAALHDHKDAGMAHTIILGCQPGIPLVLPDGPDWADVPNPPAAADGPVIVLHVLKYSGGAAYQNMRVYLEQAAEVGVPHGARIAGWLDVEGTVVGDGRGWDQALFHAFPSKAAFMAVALDPDRLAADVTHREPAITDSYTLILRPVIDDLAASLSG